MEQYISAFGDLLRTFRKRKGFTQQQLAVHLGIHRNTIGLWERGDSLPDSKTMVLELAYQLGLQEVERRQLLEESMTGFSPYWYLPFSRNSFFIGREEILNVLHERLRIRPSTQPQVYALYGLGGIGKTQVAIEFAYRYALEYRAIFWIGAETVEQSIFCFQRIAEILQLPERRETDQQRVVEAVRRWLATHDQWLLVWDNMENIRLLQDFLLLTRQGSILLTTRNQTLGTLSHGMGLSSMGQLESVSFVLRRAKLVELDATREKEHQFAEHKPAEYAAVEELVNAMGGFPLALDQAGAYIEETGCSCSGYLQHYQRQQASLLDRRGEPGGEHTQTVTATFLLAIEQVERERKIAADILCVCAVLHTETIPEEIFLIGGQHLGSALETLTTNPLEFDLAIAALRRFSLVQRDASEHVLSLHRLIQVVLQARMSEEEHHRWLMRAMAALNVMFPESSYENQRQCELLLPHVLACVTAISDREGNQDVVMLLQKAANYLSGRAQLTQAESLYLRALSIGEQILGTDHRVIGSTLRGLARLAYEQGKYEQAEPLYQRALTIQEHEWKDGHPEVATTLRGLAILYDRQGKYEQIEPLYQRALSIQEREWGPDHPEVAYTLRCLAILYDQQGKYEQAEALYQRALSIQEREWGPNYFLVAHSIDSLATFYSLQGNYERAEPLYQRALSIQEHEWGLDHPEVSYPLNNLAELYSLQGKYEQAEPLYRRALLIWEQSLGTMHPLIAHPLNGLANIYVQQNKDQQAELLYHRALSIREQHLGQYHLDVAQTLRDLATLRYKQGDLQKAIHLIEQVLSIYKSSLGATHLETVAVQQYHTQLLQAQQRTEHQNAGSKTGYFVE